MDFKTQSIDRETIRKMAKICRKIFNCKDKYYFDVIDALEQIPVKLKGVTVEITNDADVRLGGNPATTIPDMQGNYLILISQKVYDGAHERDIGGYRMHIMHEIAHVLLFMNGYTPKFNRVYNNCVIKPFESIEWQAKALAGEVLIPYEETMNLDVDTIVKKCKVSKDAVIYRKKLDDNNFIKKDITSYDSL